jgi:hypothetical protein
VAVHNRSIDARSTRRSTGASFRAQYEDMTDVELANLIASAEEPA